MTQKMKLRFIVITGLLIVYITTTAFFFYNLYIFQEEHAKLEYSQIETVRTELNRVLDGTTSTEILTEELTPFISEHPMELIIRNMSNGEVIFSTFSGIDMWSIRDVFHDDVVLLKSQGEVQAGNTTYFVSYVIYGITDESFIDSKFQILLHYTTVLSVIILITLSIIISLILKPLENLKKAIMKMNQFQLDEIIQDENVIASDLNYFAKKISRKSKEVANDYTDLEVSLQFEKERLLTVMDLSRAFVHDLKTPVHQTLIENDLVIKKYKGFEEELQILAHYNVDKSDELLKQINDILHIMDEKMINFENKVEYFDFIELFNQSWKLYQVFISKNGLSFFADIPEQLMVMMNYTGAKLILHNLLSNAVQYAKKGTEIDFSIDILDDSILTISCSNESSEENIKRIMKSDYIYIQEESEHKYSSRNGMKILQKLGDSLGGIVELHASEGIVTIQIQLPIEHDGGILNE